jgi:hypothetical protein
MTDKLRGHARTETAHDLRRRYEAGESIRSLMAHTGRSYCYVRDLLTQAGTQFRRQGYHPEFHADRGRR